MLIVGFLIGFGGLWLFVGVVRWRRRRRDPSPVTPRWLNEHVYSKEGERD